MADTDESRYLTGTLEFDNVEVIKFRSAYQRRPTVRQTDGNLDAIASCITKSDSLSVYPSVTKEQHVQKSILTDRLQEIARQGEPGLAYLADCLSVSANIKTAVMKPEDILFDVCLFRQGHPTFVLSVIEHDIKRTDDVEQYNLSLAKGVIASIRRYSSCSFSAVYGIIDLSDMLTKATFFSRLISILDETSHVCVRDSLTMTCKKYKKIIRAFIASLAVTDIDVPDNGDPSDAFWFLTLQQFCMLSENIDRREVLVKAAPGSGDKVLLLEVAKRLQNIGPVMIVSENHELLNTARKYGILTFDPATQEPVDETVTSVIISHTGNTLSTGYAETFKADRIWKFQKMQDKLPSRLGSTADRVTQPKVRDGMQHEVKEEPRTNTEGSDTCVDDIYKKRKQELSVETGESNNKVSEIQDGLQQDVTLLKQELLRKTKECETLKCELEELKHLQLRETKLVMLVEGADKPSEDITWDDSGNRKEESVPVTETRAVSVYAAEDKDFQLDSTTWEVKDGNVTLICYNTNHMLSVACLRGRLEIVKHLLCLDTVDINFKTEGGLTPVMYSALCGNKGVFDLLVHMGCDLSGRLGNGNDILHVACLGGSLSIVGYLLRNDVVDIESRGRYGRTSVVKAANVGQNKIFHFLVRKGADLSVVDNDGNNILHVACFSGNAEIAKYLIFHNISDIESRGQLGRTPVMFAARCGRYNVFLQLINEGCELSAVDKKGSSVLHVACLGNSVGIVQYLISHNVAGINSRGMHGRTPVMYAVEKGNKNIFHLLVREGCDLSELDDKKNNILHVACFGNNAEIIDYLVSHNTVDIESRGQHGRTPLMFAAEKCSTEIFAFLLKMGSDSSVLDDDGNNFLHVAAISNNEAIVKYIVSNHIADTETQGRYGRTAVMKAAFKGHLDVFTYLSDTGCELSVKDDHHNNILHLACIGGNRKIVERLLCENSIDINLRNKSGHTPLKVAWIFGRKNLSRFLKKRGCR